MARTKQLTLKLPLPSPSRRLPQQDLELPREIEEQNNRRHGPKNTPVHLAEK